MSQQKGLTRGKCLTKVEMRKSNVFYLPYRQGQHPRNEAIIEAALARAAGGHPYHWAKGWNKRGA